MTGKERILAALAGGKPDRVPFVPNIWQWFHVNQARGGLPEPLRGCTDPVEVLRLLEADVFSKFDGLAAAEVLHRCERTVSFTGERLAGQPAWSSFACFEGGSVREETVRTPDGILTHAWKYEAESGAPFESEHWWKDFDAEYAAVRSWMEDGEWVLDRTALANGLAKVGESGLVLFQLLPTPLRKSH